jgi:hypothetical protein
LEWAVSRIDVNRVSSWFSRVGTNIASSLDDATTPEQIAAYPGRISIVHNRIRHHDTPRFGSSSHLAQILLSIKKYDTETNAIINISVPISNEKVDILRINNAVLEMGWQMGMSDKGIIQQEPGSPRWDCVLDKGAFGWEPCLYIMAHNPLELVDRTHRFISALEASNA